MAWKAIDRVNAPAEESPSLSEPLKEKIRGFFDRYPTKRAVLIPALHMIQDDHGYVGWKAMEEVAELLEITPSDVFDTVSFYSHFWTHPKGEKVVMACRSISCDLLGADRVLDECKKVLGIGDHETTPDGKYSLMTEECLAACDHGPCLMINEKMHKCVDPANVRKILEDDANDKLDIPRSNLYDGANRTSA
ncbi:MAG: NAD(P)H-dependent oxidoreductase subunit E [Phycisphaerales bacterium]|nr:NAD(P)H-dependent oxidoreductase subunit E [Phycisphaerales bacterium]